MGKPIAATAQGKELNDGAATPPNCPPDTGARVEAPDRDLLRRAGDRRGGATPRQPRCMTLGKLLYDHQQVTSQRLWVRPFTRLAGKRASPILSALARARCE